MQRGVLVLTKEEIEALLNQVSSVAVSELSLMDRLEAAYDMESKEAKVEVSEEDIEYILDEVAIVAEKESSIALLEARKKLQNLLMEFRSHEDR